MRWKPFLIGLLAGAFFIISCLFAIFLLGSSRRSSAFLGSGVAVVEIKGGIYLADDVVEQLEEARKSDYVKAVVMRLNTPGGSVGASQEIYQEILKLRETKPVVASMGDVAASGGYYVACSTQRIFAMPGTITGSIGVRMSHVNIADLAKWAKVAPETLKSGAMKDAGSIYRAMSPEERELFQGVLGDMHDQFKDAVAKGRGLDRTAVDAFADGRILSGRQALDLKLVDEFGGLPEAVRSAAVLAGIKGEPKVIELGRREPWWIDLIWGDASAFGRRLVGEVLESFRPMVGYWAY